VLGSRRSSRLDLIIVPFDLDAHRAPDLEPLALTVIERAHCPVLIAAPPRQSTTTPQRSKRRLSDLQQAPNALDMRRRNTASQ
jgi:hypothetical protein